MEKEIKIEMCIDKSIKIHVNNQLKHTIESHNRSIDAQKIYDIFEYSCGDKYAIVSENTSNIDNQVVDFFLGLFRDISNKVNSLDDRAVETSEQTNVCITN